MWSWQHRGKSFGRRRKPRLYAWNLGRRCAEDNRLRLSRIRLQVFTSHIRKPVDAPVLILGFKRGKNQLSEQIETANVVIRESPSGSGRRLQHAQVLAPAAQRNQQGRASSYLAREVEFDASVGFTSGATKNAARCQAVLQKLGVADEAKATLDGERAGGRAAYHLRSFRLRSFRLQAFRQRDHDAVGLCDLLNPVADQLQHFVHDATFGLEQVAIGGAPRGRAPIPYLLVEFREGEQRAQRFLARDRFEDAVALLQRRPGVGRRRRLPVNSGWIGTHACAVRITNNPVFIVSVGSPEGSLPLLVQPANFTGARSPASLTGERQPQLELPSVIVFWGVVQWSFGTRPTGALAGRNRRLWNQDGRGTAL